MSSATTIVLVVATIGTSATLGVAQQQGWGAFGEFKQSIASLDTCNAPLRAVAWSKGIGSQPIAQTRALINWSKKASRHGASYSSWHNARSRDITCKALAHNDTKCVVKGRPCQRKAEMDFDRLF